MGIVKITTKGRVTIPAEIRKKLGIRPGMKVKFVESKGEIRVRVENKIH